MQFDELKAALRGEVVTEVDGTYDAARGALIWNGRKPDAGPRAIVRAAGTDDVQATVRFAARAGLTVSPRGSGHNFSGIALQEGIVLDLSALNDVRVDADAAVAEVGPAVRNGDLAARLAAQGLAFPYGHCSSVSLSGYLLGGGFGWNTGEWGPACHSVESAEVVLADGRLVTASATENPDLYWAVRGAGPAFFGVVVRYRLRLQRLRKGMTSAIRVYPLDRIDEVSRWMVGADAPRNVEFSAIMHSAPPPLAGQVAKVVTAVATVFAETDAEAHATLDGLGLRAPAAPSEAIGPIPTGYDALYAVSDQPNPVGARYLTEAVWSDDPRRAFRSMANSIAAAPSPLSYAIAAMMPAGSFATRPLPQAAFSMAAPAFGALYGIWTDPAEDPAQATWLRQAADALAPVSRGYYVGEADLARPERLAACYAPDAWERLKLLRSQYDPQGVFDRSMPRSSAAKPAIAAE